MTPGAHPGEEAPDPAGRGSLDVADAVVKKIAQRAVEEVEETRGHVRRVLGQRLGGADHPPRVDVDVRGSVVVLGVSMAVTWPHSVRATTDEARRRVVERVEHLTGLTVGHVDIDVPALVLPHESEPERRVA